MIVLASLLRSSKFLYPKVGVKEFWRRLLFVRQGLLHWGSLSSLLGSTAPPSLRRTIEKRPLTLGIFVWPYVHNGWDLRRRLDVLYAHHSEIGALPWLAIDVDESLVISDLSDVYPELRLAIDRPQWFLREGELCMNLFLGETRIYTLAFVFGRIQGELVSFVGGLQGRDIQEVNTLYQDLTKALHGARPRDFIVASFLMLCESVEVRKVFGVSESSRHHRHHYFGHEEKLKPSSNYDDIWRDRGGIPSDDGFFLLSVSGTRRAETDIPSKKRALYRRRYALLDKVREDLCRARALTPRTLPADFRRRADHRSGGHL